MLCLSFAKECVVLSEFFSIKALCLSIHFLFEEDYDSEREIMLPKLMIVESFKLNFQYFDLFHSNIILTT